MIYYYFKSKEEIMDALIERINTRILSAANEIALKKNIPIFERLFKTLTAMVYIDNTDHITDHMHQPQNALMHQKSHKALLKGIPPILLGIIEDGIEEKVFNTPYPYESIEMVIAHLNTVLDGEYINDLSPAERLGRIKAFIFNLERIFGAKPGSFSPVLRLFDLGREIG